MIKKIQPTGSERKRGWSSKKMMTGRLGGVFSLDFLFIEQARAAERESKQPRCKQRGIAAEPDYSF